MLIINIIINSNMNIIMLNYTQVSQTHRKNWSDEWCSEHMKNRKKHSCKFHHSYDELCLIDV